MSRTTKEWIGKTDDSKVPPRVRLRVFVRHGGYCWNCPHKIVAGEPWDLDHDVALINGGENRESNLHLLCKFCHAHKTARDVAEKSRVYKTQINHLGIKPKSRRPIPGSKSSPYKRKMDGTWEKR